MTQAPIFGVPRSGPVAPDVMAGRIDDNFDAQISSHSGASRPTYAVAGTIWLSTATAGLHKYYFFDGTNDRLFVTVDTATGAMTWPGGVINSALLDAVFAPSAAPTKKLSFGLSGITAGQTRVLTMPDRDVDLAKMWVPIGGLIDLAGLSNYAWTNLAAYRDLRVRVVGVPSGTTGIPFLRVSSNNGSSYDSGASDYTNAHSVTEGTTVAGVASVSSTSFPLGNLAFDSQPFEFNITLSEWNKAAVTSFDSNGYFGNTATGARRRQGAFGVRAASTAFDALQLSISAGTFTRGYAILEGAIG